MCEKLVAFQLVCPRGVKRGEAADSDGLRAKTVAGRCRSPADATPWVLCPSHTYQKLGIFRKAGDLRRRHAL